MLAARAASAAPPRAPAPLGARRPRPRPPPSPSPRSPARANARRAASAAPGCCAPRPRSPPTSPARRPSAAIATPRCSSTCAGRPATAGQVEQRARELGRPRLAGPRRRPPGQGPRRRAARLLGQAAERPFAYGDGPLRDLDIAALPDRAAARCWPRSTSQLSLRELRTRAADAGAGPLRHHPQRPAAARHRQHDPVAARGAVGRARADARACSPCRTPATRSAARATP